jgi:hypothetical protein
MIGRKINIETLKPGDVLIDPTSGRTYPVGDVDLEQETQAIWIHDSYGKPGAALSRQLTPAEYKVWRVK